MQNAARRQAVSMMMGMGEMELLELNSMVVGRINDLRRQKDLDEKEDKLRIQVENYLSSARSKVESMQDITRITDHVLTSPELIRTRDETCLKFDIIAREHVSKAYAQTGDKVQVQKQSSIDELVDVRETGEAALKTRGEASRSKIRAKIKNAMQQIQDLQSKYTA